MKRCNNCGWFNPDTATHCEMCDEELTGLPVENPQEQSAPAPEEAKAPAEPEVPAPPKAGNPLLETVRFAPAASEEKAVKKNFSATVMDATASLEGEEPVHCPKCRYPVFGFSETCPNCGASLKNVLKATVLPTPPATTIKDVTEEEAAPKAPAAAPAPPFKGTVREAPAPVFKGTVRETPAPAFKGTVREGAAPSESRPVRRAPKATVREIPAELLSDNQSDEVWRLIPVESPDPEILILKPGEIVTIGNRRYKFQK